MPTPGRSPSPAGHLVRPVYVGGSFTRACPLTPPPDADDLNRPRGSIQATRMPVQNLVSHGAVNDNTACGMSFMQEESMYQSHANMVDADKTDSPGFGDKQTAMPTDSDGASPANLAQSLAQGVTSVDQPDMAQNCLPSPISSINRSGSPDAPDFSSEAEAQEQVGSELDQDEVEQQVEDQAMEDELESTTDPSLPQSKAKVAQSSQDYAWTRNFTEIPYPTWDFSHTRLSHPWPSSLLHPHSKFTGTQQSDRQIYNVDVDILSVDIPQATLSGYLRICGLTEDHPTLTTFFSGEIIGAGGADLPQRYTFQTANRAWGATEKTDLTHWARFPAWRPLSANAKRDLNFRYPLPVPPGPGEDVREAEARNTWWQKDCVFMRWKEEFLVPDHRVRSIQGASFEGFYYICFNQVEGKISGIYFHARSEKYQQLELRHVFDRGLEPAMEFR